MDYEKKYQLGGETPVSEIVDVRTATASDSDKTSTWRRILEKIQLDQDSSVDGGRWSNAGTHLGFHVLGDMMLSFADLDPTPPAQREWRTHNCQFAQERNLAADADIAKL